MFKDYNKYISQLVNIKVNYSHFDFIAHYSNCIVLRVENFDLDNALLVILTDSGTTKEISLSDSKNIRIDIL